MNGTPLALGVAAGLVLAASLQRKPAGSRDRGIDRALIRELGEKLRAYTRGLIEDEVEPDEAYDPNEYEDFYAIPILLSARVGTPDGPQEFPLRHVYRDDLERALGVPVLGWGYSRVVVRVAPGIVAKLPWREDGVERNSAEVSLYNEASDEVKELMLPPLDYVYPPGVAVFPEVEVVAAEGSEKMAMPQRTKVELAKARARWLALVRSGEPGAVTEDVQNGANWGYYDGRMVLIDYEPEGGFNRVAKKRAQRRR